MRKEEEERLKKEEEERRKKEEEERLRKEEEEKKRQEEERKKEEESFTSQLSQGIQCMKMCSNGSSHATKLIITKEKVESVDSHNV